MSNIFANDDIYSKEQLVQIINRAEVEHDILPGLLLSIAKHESNLSPWVIGLSGKAINNGDMYKASAKIIELINLGNTNIDIGVMQINYHYHKNNFRAIYDMLLPENNINYAAKLLAGLYKKHQSWQTAIRYYHSKSTRYNIPYSRKIVMGYLEAINTISSSDKEI